MKTSIAAAWLAPVLAVALGACRDGGDRTEPTGADGPGAATSAPITAPTTAANRAGDGSPATDGAAAGKRLCGDLEACRAACAERRPAACLRLSRRARGGDREGVDRLLRQLCDAGHGEACFAVYLAGGGKDAKVLDRSCDMGSGAGCLALAASVGRKDRARAAELRARGMRQLEKSCQHDDASSCARIAEEARGDDGDPARARWHGEKACQLGDEEACWSVAVQLEREFPGVAARLAERACELGQADACERVRSPPP